MAEFISGLLGSLLNISPETAIWLEIGLIIIIASFFSIIAGLLKQPLIPAYILAGLIAGPIFLGVIKDTYLIRALSEIGVAFLLFFVGLEMSLNKLKNIGKVATIAGLLQVLIVGLVAFLIALAFSFSMPEIIFIALAIPFSSTAIVVKLLSDRRELNTLHARIAIGMLLVQDIIAMIALAMLSAHDITLESIAAPSLKAALLVGFAALFSITVSKPIFKLAAKSKEILILVSISTCFLFSLLAMIPIAGLPGISVVIGSFIGGVTLANSPYKIEIERNAISLRDFFVTIFFVSIGLQLSFSALREMLAPFLILLAVVIFVEPYITMALVRVFGYTKRTSFLSGFLQAQTSEFSLVLITQGLVLGLVSKSTFSMIVLITVLSMSLTPFFVAHQDAFYAKFGKVLNIFEKMPTKEKLDYITKKKKDVILFGCHRMGSIFLQAFSGIKDRLVVVDFNPDIIKELSNKKISCIYGDIGNPEILDRLNLNGAKFVVSTIPDKFNNTYLIRKVKKINPEALVFVTAEYIDDALELYEKGADYVMIPQVVGGERGIACLKGIISEKKSRQKEKESHIEYLKELKEGYIGEKKLF